MDNMLESDIEHNNSSNNSSTDQNICDKCQAEFDMKWKLERHKKNKNGCKKKTDDYICSNCDKKLSNKYNLLRHQKKCLQEEDDTNVQEVVQDQQNNSNVVSENSGSNNLETLFCKLLIEQQKQFTTLTNYMKEVCNLVKNSKSS